MKLIIDEHIASIQHYHLREETKPFQSLCGRQMLGKNLPIESWGAEVNAPTYSYCKMCERLAKEKFGIVLERRK